MSLGVLGLDADLVELPVEGRHGGADPGARVAAEVPLHVVQAVGQGVQRLDDEPELGVLLVASGQRLVT